MTINTTTTKQSFDGNGVTTAFPLSFAFYAATELEVVERVIATGVETVKQLTTHYTVSGGNGAPGTVTAVTAPSASVRWVIARKTARTQLAAYPANDPFPSSAHERALDRLTAIAQELEELIGRALTFPLTDAATAIGPLPSVQDRAARLLGFDLAGKPIPTPGSAIAGVVVSTFMQALLDDADAATARATMAAAGTLANTFTADQKIQATDAGASEGPAIVLDRNSASPAANDLLGAVRFEARSSAAATRAVAKILAELVNATDGAEEARIQLQTMVAGVLAARLTIGRGLVVGAPTGGDQGAGTINATELYRNGAALLFSAAYDSGDLTITSGGAHTLTHGLGGVPRAAFVYLKNVTGEGGYTAGQETLIQAGENGDNTQARGVSVIATATQLLLRVGSDANAFLIPAADTGNRLSITNANWRLIIRAFR